MIFYTIRFNGAIQGFAHALNRAMEYVSNQNRRETFMMDTWSYDRMTLSEWNEFRQGDLDLPWID
jgi:hypothetical protein